MPDTSRTAAGRELRAFFLNRHRTPSSGIAAAHQATFASRPTSPANHARPSNHNGRCFKLSKHVMGHNASNQRLAPLDFLSGPTLPRVRCIALFCEFRVVGDEINHDADRKTGADRWHEQPEGRQHPQRIAEPDRTVSGAEKGNQH
jgi:hypothetical protein